MGNWRTEWGNCGESAWECGESGWKYEKCGESGWRCRESRWKLKYSDRIDMAMQWKWWIQRVERIEKEHICKKLVSHIWSGAFLLQFEHILQNSVLLLLLILNRYIPVGTTPINITPIWCPPKIYHKVAFNDIHNKQRIFKVNNKSTKKWCKDLPKVNQNLKTIWQTLLWYPCCEIWTSPTPNAMLLVFTLNRHLCAELTFN